MRGGRKKTISKANKTKLPYRGWGNCLKSTSVGERERLGRWGNDYQNTHLESKYTHREMKELKKKMLTIVI